MTQIADRVREVSTSSSTGPMTLAGTVVGFRRFRDAINDGATVPYVIENGSEWEAGYGSFTAPATLNRVTVKASSNNGNLVDFSAGQKSIWIDAIADFLSTSVVAVSSVNGQTGTVVLTKSDLGLGNVNNTSDANKPVSTATQTALDAKVSTSVVGAANGVASLGSDGKLPSGQVPDIAVVSYLGTVASQAAMLALTGQQGDWCIRSDLSTTWVITGSTPSSLASWTQLSYPTAPVTSVNAKTGAVTLSASDVGAQASITVNGIVKGNGSGTLSAATSGTDYAPATSGSSILSGNGSGGFSNVTVGSGLSFAGGTLSASGGTGTVTSVSGTGTVSGLSLSGSVTTSGSLTLGGALDLSSPPAIGATAPSTGKFTDLTATGTTTLATSLSGLLKANSGVVSAATAGTDYLTGNQTITVSGDASGSGATSISLTLANSGVTAGTYRSITVDAKGRATAGTNPTTLSGYGITDAQSQITSTGLLKGAGAGSISAATAETDYVTPTGTGTLSGKTITGVKETKTAPAISAGTLTLDCSAGNVFAVSLNANITTLSFTNVPSTGTAYGLTLALTADGTARTVTWGSAVKWPSGTAPTLTSTNAKVDTFILYTHDGGTTWYAFTGGQNA